LSSIGSPRTAGTAAGAIRLRRMALLSALAALAVAAPAHADLAAVGPVDPSTEVPAWFQDKSGIKLGLCLTAPFCLSTAADFAAADGEAFYFNAGADLTINGSGKAKLVLAQEAVSAPSGPAAFMRVRVALTGAAPNATYNVTHPFGTMTMTTDDRGRSTVTQDTGCALAPCPAFNGALSGEIGPFLTWTPDSALPPNHIGDGVTPHTVTGGTNGNSFVVSGPGGASTNLFTVAGELAGPPVPIINSPSAVDFGSSAVGTPVEKTITVRSFGVPDGSGASNLSISGASLSGAGAGAYHVVANSCAGVFVSGQACAVTVQYVPTAAGAQPAALSIASNATGGNNSVALTGAGVAPATGAGAGVAGAGARSRFALSKLRTTHRLSRARVRSHGLRFTMRLPAGTEIVKVSVLRVRNGKALRKPVWFAFRHPSHAGPYRMRLNTRKLRHRLTPGLYQINITPGVSKRQLGATSSTRIRITRR
jgi:hypothetical protein